MALRKRLYLSMMTLSVIILLAVPFVPHHHHANAPCQVVEHCVNDNANNDRHTSHEDDGTSCVEKVVPPLIKSVHHGSGLTDEMTQLSVGLAGFEINLELYPVSKALHGWVYDSSCHSSGQNNTNSLRAPPLA